MDRRTRSQGPFPVEHLLVDSHLYLNGYTGALQAFQLTHQPKGLPRYHKRTVDSLLPDYHKRRRNNEILPVLPLEMTTIETTRSSGGFHAKYTGPTGATRDNYCFGPFADQNLVTEVPPAPSVNKAALLQEATAKAVTAGWDMGTSAAELTKTLRMVAGAKQSIIRFLNRAVVDLARNPKRLRSYGQAVDEIARLWMESRYGWRILGYEIESVEKAVKTIAEGTDSRFSRFTTFERTVEQSVQHFEDRSLRHDGGVSGTFFSKDVSLHLIQYREVRCGVGVDVLSTAGFVSPVVTAWELVPFSFIIDWFVNIDDLLTSFYYIHNRRLRAAWSSEIVTTVVNASSLFRQPPPAPRGYSLEILDNRPATASYRRVVRTRKAETVSSDISLRNRLDTYKVVDLAAIYGRIILKYLL